MSPSRATRRAHEASGWPAWLLRPPIAEARRRRSSCPVPGRTGTQRCSWPTERRTARTSASCELVRVDRRYVSTPVPRRFHASFHAGFHAGFHARFHARPSL
jgi:hypothetical protein